VLDQHVVRVARRVVEDEVNRRYSQVASPHLLDALVQVREFLALFLGEMMSALQWMETHIVPWIFAVLGQCALAHSHVDLVRVHLHETVGHHLIAQVAPLHISMLDGIQAFNLIIVEYPDSLMAVQDLARCLVQAHTLRRVLIQRLRADVDRRLLHLGTL
jgi:hypothetical protein